MQHLRWRASIAFVSLAVVLSAAPAGAHECSEPGEEFRINLGVLGYRDCHLEAWAARYYFPDDHDPQWLAIELSLNRKVQQLRGEFRPDDIYIVRPDGARIPLISQRTYRQQRSSMAPLLLQVRGAANRSPGGCFVNRMRFFVDDRTRRLFADLMAYSCVAGYLYFASPTGTWASGSYTLAVDGDIGLRMPIEIE